MRFGLLLLLKWAPWELPNEWNEAIAYPLRIFRVTPQLCIQDFLLIEKPPQEHGQKRPDEAKPPPRAERQRYTDKQPKRARVHRMAHICIRTSVDDLLAFLHPNIGRCETVDLDDPKHKEEREHDDDIAEKRYPRRYRRPAEAM